MEKKKKAEYDKRFIKENCRKKTILLHKEKDADIIEWLDRQENVNASIKKLIREHING